MGRWRRGLGGFIRSRSGFTRGRNGALYMLMGEVEVRCLGFC